MPSPASRPWLRRGLIAAVVILLLAGGGVAYVLAHSPGNVSHPSVEFTAPATTPAPTKKKAVVDRFEWPRYGYDGGRTRMFAGGGKLNPPFRVGWTFEDYALLEFPPVIYGHTLYLMDDDGSAKAIDARNGHKLWETKVGTLAAASPALGPKQGLLYLPILSVHGHTPGGGYFDALSMKTGRVVWSHPIQAGTEASPIAWGNAVYLGDQSGTV
jgi:outer membrane protein assembly factor BamB